MRPLSRCLTLLLAVLLLAQPGWAQPECGSTGMTPEARHGSHHTGRPAPVPQHLPCQTAACTAMTGCLQLALAEPDAAPPPPEAPGTAAKAAAAPVLPCHLVPPEPPPPRA
jgi:hypothetical protein